MKKVDFFIVGAPKSGTTSLYEYLLTHPDICFSDSKEPHFFSFDFPGYCTTSSIQEYHNKEFGHCTCKDKIWGEASVWYLYSKVALQEIKKYNPNAKIIVMLRNPVDMLYSLHSQMLYNLDEDITDFEKAWSMQQYREENKHFPRRCRVPEFLLYKNVGEFGEQVARVYENFERENVKIILFEELSNSPAKVYLDVLSFLELDDDGRSDFHIANPNKSLKFKSLAVLIERPPKFLVSLVSFMKRITGVHRFGVYRLLANLNERINSRKFVRKRLSEEFRASIKHSLSKDLVLLESLIERDLSSWK